MKIHFIGIGGIGVSALAQYYLKNGHQVFGSDLAPSEIIEMLRKMGAEIYLGSHKKENISKDIDLIIYSPAVQSENPEFKKARQLKIKCQSYPEALGDLTKKYFTIAVSGTHGKSTTTAMIAKILIKAGLNPTVIIGTKLKEFGNSNFRMGSDKVGRSRRFVRKFPILVIEADEHFASFLNYWPKIIVLTNIEADHLDYYKNLRNILKTFKKYISQLPKEGILIANKDDKNIHSTFSTVVKNVLWHSLEDKESKKLKKILKVPGEHNVYNALAALTAARVLKIPDKISFKALSEYRGSWRRFEEKTIKLKTINYKLISDYAHHPTEIRATLKAAREKYPKKKIWCVFQPHQYQRTFYLFSDFVKVFVDTIRLGWIDKLILIDIYDVVGREEKKIKKIVSSKKLIEKISKAKLPRIEYLTFSSDRKKRLDKKFGEKMVRNDALYIPTIKEVGKYLRKNLKGGEVVIVMGAGDIYKLCEQF